LGYSHDTMYLPPHFKSEDFAIARDLITAHPFASLISTDDAQLPFVTHLPLHLVPGQVGDDVADPVLLGHVAKPNPHWRYLQARPTAVVTFMGPHAYMSPRVYPDLVRVPTWNYLAVHCTVEARLIEDPQAKDALLKKLIGDHDPAYAPQWRGLEHDYQLKMLAGIMAFELRITALQCKLKLNQHRPESHDAMLVTYAAGNDNERALADWMRRLRIAPSALS
jgi:transcriptional regulator